MIEDLTSNWYWLLLFICYVGFNWYSSKDDNNQDNLKLWIVVNSLAIGIGIIAIIIVFWSGE